MLISDILKHKGDTVITLSPDASASEAVTVLANKRIGAVVVSSTGYSIEGILSERDIVTAISRGETDMNRVSVADLMTRAVITCSPTDTVDRVIEIMDANYIRHVPVVNDSTLVGLVSVRDVVSARMRTVELERAHMQEYITGGLTQSA